MSESEQPTVEDRRTCPSCGEPIPPSADACPGCAATNAEGGSATARPYSGPREIAGFRIVREIGTGGMGSVYEAIEQKMRRRVALKVLSHRLAPSEKANLRFEREAWIAGRLNHPNLVKVFEQGDWLDTSFYTMELVDGGSLHDVIIAMRTWGQDDRWGLKFGTREYVSWAMTQVAAAARALDYAHRQGVVHRDIKPMNILLARDPCAVKIADFGIALDTEASRMTSTGIHLGTFAYMSPEQIRGDTDRIDGRCDVYALGVTLFELLTLELPYTGATQQLYMNSVLTGQARRPSRLNERVSRDLDVVLGKALEKDPKDRYATASALAEDLENVLAFRPIHARPPSLTAKTAKWIRRKPIHAALVAVLVLGAPAVSILALRGMQQQRLLAKVEMETLWTTARRFFQTSRYDEASKTLTGLLDRDPVNLRALRARALAYHNLARAKAEAPERKRLQDLALSDASRLIELSPNAAWAYRVRAYLLTALDRRADAARDLERAEALRPALPGKDDLQVDGLLALEAGDNARAVSLYSRFIALDPSSVEVRLFRAAAYKALGRMENARADYEVAAALTPQDPIPQQNLGWLLTLGDRLEEGAVHYEQALKLDPSIPLAHTGLADNLLRQGARKSAGGEKDAALSDFKAAEAESRKAIELDSNLGWGHLNLGWSLREQYVALGSANRSLLDGAVAEYERVLAIWRAAGADPKEEVHGKALADLCDALLLAGDTGRALTTCRAAADASPADPLNQYNLAGAYALLGHKEEALRALERDFELGDRDVQYLSSDRWFESVRGDPRFLALVRRMKEDSARPRP